MTAAAWPAVADGRPGALGHGIRSRPRSPAPAFRRADGSYRFAASIMYIVAET
jgi:hypothetical protein